MRTLFQAAALCLGSATAYGGEPAPNLAATISFGTREASFGELPGEGGLESADLDGDGIDELIGSTNAEYRFSTVGYLFVGRWDGARWRVARTSGALPAFASAIDVFRDRDGAWKAAVSTSGEVRLYSLDDFTYRIARPKDGWSHKRVFATDLDGDGPIELVTLNPDFGTSQTYVRVTDLVSGAERFNRALPLLASDMAVGDVQDGTSAEIVVACQQGYVLSGVTGATVGQDPDGFGALVVTGNFDADAPAEIAGVSNSRVRVYDRRESIVRGFPMMPADFQPQALTAGNVDGDQVDDIVMGEYGGRLRAVSTMAGTVTRDVPIANESRGLALARVSPNAAREAVVGISYRDNFSGPALQTIALAGLPSVRNVPRELRGDLGFIRTPSTLYQLNGQAIEQRDPGTFSLVAATGPVLPPINPFPARRFDLGQLDADAPLEMLIATDLSTPALSIAETTGAVARTIPGDAAYRLARTIDVARALVATRFRVREIRLSDGATLWESPLLSSQIESLEAFDVDRDGDADIVVGSNRVNSFDLATKQPGLDVPGIWSASDEANGILHVWAGTALQRVDGATGAVTQSYAVGDQGPPGVARVPLAQGTLVLTFGADDVRAFDEQTAVELGRVPNEARGFLSEERRPSIGVTGDRASIYGMSWYALQRVDLSLAEVPVFANGFE